MTYYKTPIWCTNCNPGNVLVKSHDIGSSLDYGAVWLLPQWPLLSGTLVISLVTQRGTLVFEQHWKWGLYNFTRLTIIIHVNKCTHVHASQTFLPLTHSPSHCFTIHQHVSRLCPGRKQVQDALPVAYLLLESRPESQRELIIWPSFPPELGECTSTIKLIFWMAQEAHAGESLFFQPWKLMHIEPISRGLFDPIIDCVCLYVCVRIQAGNLPQGLITHPTAQCISVCVRARAIPV